MEKCFWFRATLKIMCPLNPILCGIPRSPMSWNIQSKGEPLYSTSFHFEYRYFMRVLQLFDSCERCSCLCSHPEDCWDFFREVSGSPFEHRTALPVREGQKAVHLQQAEQAKRGLLVFLSFYITFFYQLLSSSYFYNAIMLADLFWKTTHQFRCRAMLEVVHLSRR